MSFDIPGSAWSAAVAAAATDNSSEPKSGLPPSIFKVQVISGAEQFSSVPPPPPPPSATNPLSQQQQQPQQPVDIPIPSSAWSAAVAAGTSTAINPLSLQARGLPTSILNGATEEQSAVVHVQTSVMNTSANATANTSDIPAPRFGKRPHENNTNDSSSSNRNISNISNNYNRKNKRPRRRGKQEQEPAILPPAGCSVCKIVQENEPPKYKCPKCRASYCSVACCRKHKLVCPGKEGSSPPDSTGTTTNEAAGTSTLAQTQRQTPGNLESDTDDDSVYDDDDDDSSLEDGWQITDDMKVALRNSTWLRSELQDGGLRSMMKQVVRYEKNYKSHHRRKDKWRQASGNFNKKKNSHKRNNNLIHPNEVLGAKRSDNKNFDVFVDKLLVLADVLERQDGPSMNLESSGEQLTSFATTASTMTATSGGGTLSSSNRNEEELEEWLRMPFDQPGMAPPSLALRPRQKTIPKFEPVVLSSSEDEEGDDDEGDPEDDK